mmetsp:Transcript_9282/g.29508  ORF Transcript_9282/g.29508 Transcript_9282/m.29508 type:complete len:84 (+) Transcript_9282:172-423(+)
MTALWAGFLHRGPRSSRRGAFLLVSGPGRVARRFRFVFDQVLAQTRFFVRPNGSAVVAFDGLQVRQEDHRVALRAKEKPAHIV